MPCVFLHYVIVSTVLGSSVIKDVILTSLKALGIWTLKSCHQDLFNILHLSMSLCQLIAFSVRGESLVSIAARCEAHVDSSDGDLQEIKVQA